MARHSYEVKVSRVIRGTRGADGRPVVEPVRGTFKRAEGLTLDHALAAAREMVAPLKLRLRSVNVSEQRPTKRGFLGTIVVVLDDPPEDARGLDPVKRSHLTRGLPPEVAKQ